MAGDGARLPDGWEIAIPESLWPAALISAIRLDPGALSSARAITTIRAWKAAAHGPSESPAKREAIERLREIGVALLAPPSSSRAAPPAAPSVPPKKEEEDKALLKRFAREIAGDVLGTESQAQVFDSNDAFRLDSVSRGGSAPPRDDSATNPPSSEVHTVFAFPGPEPLGSQDFFEDPAAKGTAASVPALTNSRQSAVAPPSTPRSEPPARPSAPPGRRERPVLRPVESEERSDARARRPRPSDAPERPGTQRGDGPTRAGAMLPDGLEISNESPAFELTTPEQRSPFAGTPGPTVVAGAVVPAVREFSEEDERPTTAMPLPSQRNDSDRDHSDRDHSDRGASDRGASDRGASGGISSDGRDKDELTHDLGDWIEPPRPPPGPPPAPEPSLVGPAPSPPAASVPPPMIPSTGGRRVAPKPGSVRRSVPPPLPTAQPTREPRETKPRASMMMVQAIYGAILPLCKELAPLAPERRSRRFWALWREASGNRGVRRDIAEEILRSAPDVLTLAAELIAEAQSVDVDSVRAHIVRIDAEGQGPAGSGAPRLPMNEERARGPLVGAPVRIEDGSEK
ncbi:MAG: hypothetical protein IT384_20220 [Deltaproteobacteria bacterium]|nr:hypothetical protein [Deltaproteobacteria bacterium]